MRPDVIVVGGGLMGCSTALALADAGLLVHLLERSIPGAEASSAAAGILAPCIESHGHDISLELGLASRRMHAELSERLRQDVGLDVGFRVCGALKVAFDDNGQEELETLLSSLKAAGMSCERLDALELREKEERISARSRGGVFLPDEAQIDPPALLNAVALAAQTAGVTFRKGATVREILLQGSKVIGVQVDDERLEADNVVVAAGSWTTLIPGLKLGSQTIHPIRGQLFSTRSRPPIFKSTVFSSRGYVVTRPDGRVICGSTEERVGFSRGVTLNGLRTIIDTATEIAPSLGDAVIESQWSSFRPGTPDGLPLVGKLGADGLFIASGHFRNGILLAPITAKLVSDLITGGEDNAWLAALNPTRFSEAKHD